MSLTSAHLLALTSLLVLTGGLAPGGTTLAQMSTAAAPATPSNTFPGAARPDAPALSARGQYAVGVRTISLVRKDVVDLAKAGTTTPLPRYDRRLTVEVWYPAALSAGQSQSTSYKDTLGSGPGDPKHPLVPFTFPGRAAREAAPDVTGGRYPLVIFSHGYPGSRYLMSYLAENLASKGYVVASIDHTDSTHADKAAFSSTLLNRAPDDQAVLDGVAALSTSGSGFLNGLVDADNTALLGYSMGGYGALNFAGAGLADAVMGFAPDGALKARQNPVIKVDPRLKAVVAFAPWGGTSALKYIGVTVPSKYGFWEAESLAQIKVPTLFLVGDHDDVAGYEGGVKSLFEGAVNSDRYMVVYQNARHNSAPNPPPAASYSLPDDYEHYSEPAWDSQKLNNLNEHFVTAFLNYRLKGDAASAEYLNVPTVIAADGWKGFRPRTALGIELYHMNAK